MADEIIDKERIAALRRMGICSPASVWLSEPHTYKELVEQHPEWVVVAALQPSSNLKALELATIAYGSDRLRRSFARHVAGADTAALLQGVAPSTQSVVKVIA